jgi:hypothetical protein
VYVHSDAPLLRADLEQAHAEFKEELRTKMEEFTDSFLDPTTATTPCPLPTPAAPTIAPLKVAKPSDYDGSHDKYKTFTHKLAIYLATTPFTTECQKIIVALSFMKTGSAAHWANSYLLQLQQKEEEILPRQTSWDDFMEDLKTVFSVSGDVSLRSQSRKDVGGN